MSSTSDSVIDPPIHVTVTDFKPASAALAATGLLGMVRFSFNGGLDVRGCAVRRTHNGERAISWPAPRTRSGEIHRLLRPLNCAAQRELDQIILEALRVYLEKRVCRNKRNR